MKGCTGGVLAGESRVNSNGNVYRVQRRPKSVGLEKKETASGGFKFWDSSHHTYGGQKNLESEAAKQEGGRPGLEQGRNMQRKKKETDKPFRKKSPEKNNGSEKEVRITLKRVRAKATRSKTGKGP